MAGLSELGKTVHETLLRIQLSVLQLATRATIPTKRTRLQPTLRKD